VAENGYTNGTGRAPLPAALFAELGSVGLKRGGGVVAEEYVRDLTGIRGIRTYTQMGTDEILGGVLYANEVLLRQVPWSLLPASDLPDAQDAAGMVEGMLFDDMSQTFASMLSDALSCQLYGWAFHEMVWKRRLGPTPPPGYDALDPAWAWWAPSQFDDGLLGLRKLPIRAQETLMAWDFDDAGGVRAMIQQDPWGGTHGPVRIPMDKALLFRVFTYKGNPEGKSLVRSAYDAWYYKKHIRRIEGIGVERDLAGLFHARIPVDYMLADAGPAQQAIFEYIKQMGRSIHRDEQECLVTPLVYDDKGNELFKFELMSTGGSRQFNTTEIVERYDTRMLQSVLANILMVGLRRVGTQALAEELSDLYTLGLTTILDSITDVFNRYCIPRIWQLNAFPRETMPVLSHGRVMKVDFDKFTTGILRMAQAGVVWTPADEAYIRLETGFPELMTADTAEAL